MNSRRRVLYICPNSRKGGAEQVTVLVAKHHDPSHFSPEIYFFSDGPLVHEARGLGIRCHLRESSKKPLRLRDPWGVAREISAISSLLKREKFDIVHSVMGYAHLFGGPAAAIAGIPEVWFQHGPTGSLDWLTGRMPTRALLVNSQYTLGMQRRFRATADRVRLIHLGVEAVKRSDWIEGSRAFRDRFQEGTFLFGISGRLAPLKGHLLLARAADILLRKSAASGKGVGFVVMGDVFSPGDAQYLRTLNSSIKELDLVPHFHFTGHLSPPYSAVAACDVMVNASISPEAFGLSLAEAMMLEVPVIAPAEGGPLELVDAGKTGLLFEPRSAESLASAMLEYMGSAELRANIAAQAKVTVNERFNANNMTSEIESVYSEVLESRA